MILDPWELFVISEIFMATTTQSPTSQTATTHDEANYASKSTFKLQIYVKLDETNYHK